MALAFGICATIILVLLISQPSSDLESAVDWIAALGTWSVGFGAMAISWRAGEGQAKEHAQASNKRLREEFAGLFTIQSLARRATEAAETMTEYFRPDGSRLPIETTTWVIQRLISRISDERIRNADLSVLRESDQDLFYDFEEDIGWIIAIANDLMDLMAKNPTVNPREQEATKYLLEAVGSLKKNANALVKSTSDRREVLRPLLH
ncbi:hypothetical protein AR275_26355 [Stenotrophomonas maltophilia]|nr:hypothetical protein AR275_26355 [Stenotrophomonas maltophilia]